MPVIYNGYSIEKFNFFLFTVDEMKQLAKTLIQYKPMKKRQEIVVESLDSFSIDYPELYSHLFREIKNRRMEFNDLNKISKWLNTSTSNNFVKLHEALILVNKNNIIAQEQYINDLKYLLSQTIEKKTNLEEAVKICCLIKRLPNLSFIYE